MISVRPQNAARARAGAAAGAPRHTQLVDEFFGDGDRSAARVFRDRAFADWSDHRPLSITVLQEEGGTGSGGGGGDESAGDDLAECVGQIALSAK